MYPFNIERKKMDSNLRRAIIIDNYQNPVNKKVIENNEFIKVNTKSQSCIDDITLYVKLDNDKIIDIYFDGEACAITTSATSIMIKSLIGKTLKDAEVIINNYYNMIEEKEYDKNLLGELNVYDEIYKQSNRKKCATLPFDTLKKAIKIYEDK